MAKNRELTTTAQGLMTGAIGGAAATAGTYPMDTVITAKQVGGYEKLLRNIKEQGKLKALYPGMSGKIVKNMLTMGLTFGAANLAKDQFMKKGSAMSLRALGFHRIK